MKSRLTVTRTTSSTLGWTIFVEMLRKTTTTTKKGTTLSTLTAAPAITPGRPKSEENTRRNDDDDNDNVAGTIDFSSKFEEKNFFQAAIEISPSEVSVRFHMLSSPPKCYFLSVLVTWTRQGKG